MLSLCRGVCVFYFCSEYGNIFTIVNSALQCGDVAGHTEHHNCKTKPHVCTHQCSLFGFLGCNEVCYKPVDHKDEHKYYHNTTCMSVILTFLCRCNSPHHYCGKPCALPTCTNTCKMAADIPDHMHYCGAQTCPHKCWFVFRDFHRASSYVY